MLKIIEIICFVPIIGGSVYSILCLVSVLILKSRIASKLDSHFHPPVTLLKPIYGLEKNLKENLRTACVQNYPDYQVIYTVQRQDDPAIPVLKEIQQEFGSEKVTVVIENHKVGLNGKINNLAGAIPYAKHPFLIISDSDIKLRPDYLKAIIPPLENSSVGYVCTLFKAFGVENWYEKMELLTMNADFIPNVIFAYITGASDYSIGGSIAFRRSTLDEIGGFESLGDYFVEDYEFGKRIRATGKKAFTVPYFIETIVDLKKPSQWWNHQFYWDINTRYARPIGFFFTILIRAIPFAFLNFIIQLGSISSILWLILAIFIRLSISAVILGWGLKDKEGIRSLYLLPFRDLAGIVTWFLAFTRKIVIWRGDKYKLTRNGRLVPYVS